MTEPTPEQMHRLFNAIKTADTPEPLGALAEELNRQDFLHGQTLLLRRERTTARWWQLRRQWRIHRRASHLRRVLLEVPRG